MKKTIVALVTVVSLSACTTTERDVATGAGIGALAGGLIADDLGGALVGGAIGAAGGLLVRNLRNMARNATGDPVEHAGAVGRVEPVAELALM